MRESASVIIDRPIREVFSYVADPSCWPEWITGVRAIERRSTRSLDVGDTFDRIDRPAAHRPRTSWEVTEHEPPRLLGCRRIAGGSPAFIRQVLESVGGSTRLTVCSEGEVSDPVADGVEAQHAIARHLERDLEGLKAKLESRDVEDCAPGMAGSSFPDAWRASGRDGRRRQQQRQGGADVAIQEGDQSVKCQREEQQPPLEAIHAWRGIGMKVRSGTLRPASHDGAGAAVGGPVRCHDAGRVPERRRLPAPRARG